ncbi:MULTISPECIES: hypothetical protein [unclassified Variovorax]|uniref:hypothetical protein n=1 Tax=unclassified Variovorax TaxID=663243 RepID=UPI0013177289|nr:MULTISPECIES: hypothetical protein [unclassified Variovorax]VTU42034.1 hypothetical protein SRS16P1_00179 [Variovorax sp. SRS16]VTU42068.1 hypothetical protein E5P1_00177 [Variovorax sp. PBL-E5]VTU44416.1 hypothetical protein H6P1_00754 [Variovorax sp. PBL-H6]
MQKSIHVTVAVAAVLILAGCGSVNSTLAKRHETVEHYHVFQVKTRATPDAVIKATADGLARNTNSVVQNRPLQMGAKVPETAGRFQLVDPAAALGGTSLGAIMAMQGGAGASIPRVAKCDGAVWTSRANRSVSGSDNLTLYTCIYRYKDGYELNMYAVFQKASGGLSGLARDAVASAIGTPEEWTNKTILDMARSVESATGAKVEYVEGQPEIGAVPKVDQLTQR